MLAKNEKGEMVEVPEAVADLASGIKDFKQRRQVVKAACNLTLPEPPVEEQILGTGEWVNYTRKGKKEEHLYAKVGDAILPDGSTATGLFIRAELVPAVYAELGRLIANKPA